MKRFQSSLISLFDDELFKIESFGNFINQYNQSNSQHDKLNAEAIRRLNLVNYVTHFKSQPKYLLVGEAPGFKGCRFSGIPFVSETILLKKGWGRQSSVGSPKTEYSSTIVQNYLDLDETVGPFFLWNAFPFHPFLENRPDKNRKPSRVELEIGAFFLKKILERLNFPTTIAVGKTSENVITSMGLSCIAIRHPSFGGSTQFKSQLEKVIKFK